MNDLNDPIEKIFEEINQGTPDIALELFSDDRTGDIALKTDLTHKEHILVSCLMTENKLIQNDLKGFNLYGDFLDEFRRHKLSLDRGSRGEFSNVLQGGIKDKDLQNMSNLQNLTDSRK